MTKGNLRTQAESNIRSIKEMLNYYEPTKTSYFSETIEGKTRFTVSFEGIDIEEMKNNEIKDVKDI